MAEQPDMLDDMPGWKNIGSALQKDFDFSSAAKLREFVQELHRDAQKYGYTPQLTTQNTTATVTLSFSRRDPSTTFLHARMVQSLYQTSVL